MKLKEESIQKAESFLLQEGNSFDQERLDFINNFKKNKKTKREINFIKRKYRLVSEVD